MDGYQGVNGTPSSVFATTATKNNKHNTSSISSHPGFVTPSLPPLRLPYEAAPTPSGLSQLAHILQPPLSSEVANKRIPRNASTSAPSGTALDNSRRLNTPSSSSHPRSSPRPPSRSPGIPKAKTTAEGDPTSSPSSSSSSPSDSESNRDSRVEASSPFEDEGEEEEEEDEEDEDEDDEEDLVEEEDPIDWTAIDANAFFQNWLLPTPTVAGRGGEHGEEQRRLVHQQMDTSSFSMPQLQPQQTNLSTDSTTPVLREVYHEPQQPLHQQEMRPMNDASPNLSAAIEILTKVLGEGQEVPSQVLEMLLQSVAPTFGYQPPTPSQEPGIESLVPILKDLIKKQQFQEQQQQQQARGEGNDANVGSSSSRSVNSVTAGQSTWALPNQPHQQRKSRFAPSPLPSIGYESLTPQAQPFNWIPMATPADDDEDDDEDKDPSYNPAMGIASVAADGGGGGMTLESGGMGIQDALQEQMNQYLNSPFVVTPSAGENASNRPSPLQHHHHHHHHAISLPSQVHPPVLATPTSLRTSPRKAQKTSRNGSTEFGEIGHQSGMYPPGSSSPSSGVERVGHRADARKRTMEQIHNAKRKRTRNETIYSEQEEDETLSGRIQTSGCSVDRSPSPSHHDDRNRDASLTPSSSPARSPPNDQTSTTIPTTTGENLGIAKRVSNAGRKPIFENEEERRAARLEQNRKYQKEYRARKRAERYGRGGGDVGEMEVSEERQGEGDIRRRNSTTTTAAATNAIASGSGHGTKRVSMANSKSVDQSVSKTSGMSDLPTSKTNRQKIMDPSSSNKNDPKNKTKNKNKNRVSSSRYHEEKEKDDCVPSNDPSTTTTTSSSSSSSAFASFRLDHQPNLLELKTQNELLRQEVERLRNENVQLRVEVEIGRRSRCRGGVVGSAAVAAAGGGGGGLESGYRVRVRDRDRVAGRGRNRERPRDRDRERGGGVEDEDEDEDQDDEDRMRRSTRTFRKDRSQQNSNANFERERKWNDSDVNGPTSGGGLTGGSGSGNGNGNRKRRRRREDPHPHPHPHLTGNSRGGERQRRIVYDLNSSSPSSSFEYEEEEEDREIVEDENENEEEMEMGMEEEEEEDGGRGEELSLRRRPGRFLRVG